MVLIGDHHQLPPVVEEEDLSGLRRGTMEWHLARKSYFEMLWGDGVPDNNKIVLQVQHRMHPAIRHLVSQRFYRGTLRDGDVVKSYRRLKLFGQHRTLIWIDSAGAEVREVRTGNGSIYNVNHVNICRSLVRLLSERTPAELNIALIGMYREQVRRYGNASQWTHRDFRADTVDAFEGNEADIVIVDLVRSNPRGMVGFLEVHNRINVAMSRAKRLLIVVGDSQTVRQNRVLRQVLEGFRRSGAIVPWHRLPNIKSSHRRRRWRDRQPPGSGPRPATPGPEAGAGVADSREAPRRLPRPRPGWGADGAPAATADSGGARPPGTSPGGEDGAAATVTQPGAGRRRHRRRRRRPRFRQAGDVAQGPGATPDTSGSAEGSGDQTGAAQQLPSPTPPTEQEASG